MLLYGTWWDEDVFSRITLLHIVIVCMKISFGMESTSSELEVYFWMTLIFLESTDYQERFRKYVKTEITFPCTGRIVSKRKIYYWNPVNNVFPPMWKGPWWWNMLNDGVSLISCPILIRKCTNNRCIFGYNVTLVLKNGLSYSDWICRLVQL